MMSNNRQRVGAQLYDVAYELRIKHHLRTIFSFTEEFAAGNERKIVLCSDCMKNSSTMKNFAATTVKVLLDFTQEFLTRFAWIHVELTVGSRICVRKCHRKKVLNCVLRRLILPIVTMLVSKNTARRHRRNCNNHSN